MQRWDKVARVWPGPKSQALLEARRRYVARGVSSATPLFAARGSGVCLEDVDGNIYLDFAGGIGALAVGHAHPKVVQAIRKQAERFSHTCFSVVMYDEYVELARRLTELTPGNFEKKAVLFNSGAEAVENAIKLARIATGRPGVISFHNSFHGRTLLALSMTGRVRPYKEGFGPFLPDVYLAPFPYVYRFPGSEDACINVALDGLRELFAAQVSPQNIAALVLEPIQGEGGFVVAPPRFLRELVGLCHQHGILFIADEIQTGFGRTGRMFAVEHNGVVPDLVITAKSLAAGLPLSAVIGRAEILDAVPPGGLGGTYGGNPVACAAALAVLEVFEEERLVDRARWLGELIRPRLDRLKEECCLVGDVRGLGPMLALELVHDRDTKEPAAEQTKGVLGACHRRGLIVIRAGLYDNVIRLLLPLITPEEAVDRGVRILEAVLAEVSTGT